MSSLNMDNDTALDANQETEPSSPESIASDAPTTTAPVFADTDVDTVTPASIALEKLDPKGDLILEFGQYRLLVSSKVLELSCPFFQKLLQPDVFLEGVEKPSQDEPPTKTIHEDQTEILYLICRILHYLPVERPESIIEYELLADLCNFYGCARAIAVHMQTWIKHWSLSKLNVTELQIFLWAAFVFQLRDDFEKITVELAAAMTTKEWKSWDVHPMPPRLRDDMIELCQDAKTRVQTYIEATLDKLTASEVNHDSLEQDSLEHKRCRGCGMLKPIETKRCGNCGSREFGPSVCSNHTRVSSFTNKLYSLGQWPMSKLNGQSCRTFLKPGIPFQSGPCGLQSCPYVSAVNEFFAGQGSVFANMQGLKLENYDAEFHVED